MNCKLFLIASTAAAIIILDCNGALTKQRFDPGTLELKVPPDQFSSDFIKMNRLVAIDRSGNISETTDEEVIKILAMAESDFPEQLFTESDLLGLLESDEGGLDRNKRKVIGYDNRTKVIGYDNRTRPSSFGFPSCAIGYLASGCTAFLIGPFHALTAGHCVYSNDTFEDNLDVYIGRNCVKYGRRMPWVKAWTLEGWRINGSREFDLGLILLSSARPAKSPCWFQLGYFDPMPPTPVPSEICGYPYDTESKCLACATCADVRLARINQLAISQNMYQYTCDAVKGESGSPVMIRTTQGVRAIGVHTAGSNVFEENYGTRITKQLYLSICSWMCNNRLKCSDLC